MKAGDAAIRIALALGTGALLLGLGGCYESAPSPARPNVLLIVADDLGYNDLAANNGNAAIRTPSLDALAREGVRFTRHYADAVCSPARAALLSGIHPARLGFEPNGRGLSPQVVTLAEALAGAGYRTMHIGKWHIGHTVREAWPDRQGFDHWFGFLNQWYLSGEHANGVLSLGADQHLNPWLQRDGDAGRRYSGYLDDILTEEAERQLRALGESGDPWFLNLWYYAPHAPITPSPAFASRYPDTPAGRYRALVEQLDANVGRVLQTLAETDQKRSTLVVFLSDNGATDSLPDSNAPFFGIKTTFYEGGLRTPLLIRDPDGRGAGTTNTRATAIYDLYPTILARAGIAAPPGLDGRDLAGNAAAPRDLYWETWAKGHFGYSALHEERWRLYKVWPWTPWETPAQLFDVDAGGTTPRNLAAEQPVLLARLTESWGKWHREVHTPALAYTADASGAGSLSGADFLRTPGFGGFSFAIAFADGYSGRLAEQEGVWSMAANGREVVAEFGAQRLAGDLASAPCHSAIVSAWFSRRISSLPGAVDRMRLALFLDGRAADTKEETGVIDDANFAAPTLVGAAGATDHVSPPLLLTAPVEGSEAWSAESLHHELCAQLPQQGLQTK